MRSPTPGQPVPPTPTDQRTDVEDPGGPAVVDGPGRRRRHGRRRAGRDHSRQRRVQRRRTGDAARRLDHRRVQRARRLPDRACGSGSSPVATGSTSSAPSSTGRPASATTTTRATPAGRSPRSTPTSSNWLRTTTPRTVLLHIGTNDMYSTTTCRCPGPAVHAHRPDHRRPPRTRTCSSRTIIPKAGARSGRTTPRSRIVQSQAAAGNRAPGRHVQRPDLSDLADGVHPNATGYRKMAAAWYDALRRCPAASATLRPSAAPPTTPAVRDCRVRTRSTPGTAAHRVGLGDQHEQHPVNGGPGVHLPVGRPSPAVERHSPRPATGTRRTSVDIGFQATAPAGSGPERTHGRARRVRCRRHGSRRAARHRG